MSTIRPGRRVTVCEGWARTRSGTVLRVTPDGYATVTLDGGLYTMVHVTDLRCEGSALTQDGGPESTSQASDDARQDSIDPFHRQFPAA